jgi:hypothetical protein
VFPHQDREIYLTLVLPRSTHTTVGKYRISSPGTSTAEEGKLSTPNFTKFTLTMVGKYIYTWFYLGVLPHQDREKYLPLVRWGNTIYPSLVLPSTPHTRTEIYCTLYFWFYPALSTQG